MASLEFAALRTDAASKPSVLKEAWDRYLTTLDEMRAKIESSPQFESTPNQRARAYHILMEMQAVVYIHALAPRMSHPRVFRNTAWHTDVFAMAGIGPDFCYYMLYLDGKQTYRLSGHVRDSRLLLAQVNSGLPASPGARLMGNYDFSSFKIRPDGSFDIIVSATRHDGNYIALDADSAYQFLLFRPLVESWDAVPAELSVERISPIGIDHYESDEFDEAATALRIDVATGYVRYMVESWTTGFYQHVHRNSGGINIFKITGVEIAGEVGSPSAEYVFAVYEVENDEALILEMDAEPNGLFWSYQLDDVWLRPIDFRTRQTTLHGKQIAKNADGGVRVVVSRQDPGVANWLDTCGYTKGQILLRNYCSSESTIPLIRRMKYSDLDKHLPTDAKRVTPTERSLELDRRRAAYKHRYGE